MPLPRLTRQRVLQVQTETTYGTSPAAGSPPFALIDITDPIVVDQTQYQERMTMAGSGRERGTRGPRVAQVTFTSHAFGNASTGWQGILLPACGFVATGSTYNPSMLPPASAGSDTRAVTLRWYADGVLHRVRAAMGNLVINATAGQRVELQWTFTGILEQGEAGAVPAYTIPNAIPIIAADSALSIASTAVRWNSATIDLGNQVTMREYGSAVSGGAFGAVIVDRATTGTASVEAELIAAFDPENLMNTLAANAYSLTLGAAGNRLTIAAPAAQITGLSHDDLNGVHMHGLTLAFNRTGGTAGNNELSITTA